MRNLALAIDLGGTRYRLALVDRGGKLLKRVAGDTRQLEGPARWLARIGLDLDHLLEGVNRASLAGGGVSAPGPLDSRTGFLLWPPNLPSWHGLDLAGRLSVQADLPVWIENDANLGVLAERRWGAGREIGDLIYLTLSTGIGSGVISGGRLLTGRDGLAVEAGHMTVDLEGPDCPCGSSGCLERLASGTWIAANARERLTRGAPSSLQSLPLATVTAASVATAASQGDALALEIIGCAGRALGVALANLINLFNPSLITLGGGVAEAGEILLLPAIALARQRAMRGFADGLRIEKTALGEHVTLLGAAALAFERSR